MDFRGKRILFVMIPEKGHIHPLIGLAKHLYEQGAKLAVFSRKNLKREIAMSGIDADLFASEDVMPSWFSSNGASFAEHQNDKEWMSRWLKTMLIDVVPNQVSALAETVEQFVPELIIADPMVYAVHIVASRKNIPWVAVSSSINQLAPVTWNSDLTEAFDKYAVERAELFDDRPTFRLCDVVSPWLNFAYFSETYMPRYLSQNFHAFMVGSPCDFDMTRGDEPEFPYETLADGKKLLLVSLGSQNFYHPEVYQAVVDSVKERDDVQLVMSVGNTPRSLLENLPDDAVVLPYVPQLTLLKRAYAFITHGGSNSTLEALANGVPVGIIPLCNDQFFQAEMARLSNVGVVLDGINIDADSYRRLINELIDNNAAYRHNALQVMESIRKSGGVGQMTELIANLMENHQPLRPAVDVKKKKRRLYISPHLDDVALGCGMKLWLERDDENIVATVFTDGGATHPQRRNDDIEVLKRLNVHYIHMGYKDAPFRDSGYRDFKTIMFHRDVAETELADRLFLHIEAMCDQFLPDEVYFPLGVGGHVDHNVVASVGRRMMESRSVYFYEDAPYNSVHNWTAYRLKSFFGANIEYDSSIKTLREQGLPFVNNLLDKAGNGDACEIVYKEEMEYLTEETADNQTVLIKHYTIDIDKEEKGRIVAGYTTEWKTFLGSEMQKQLNAEKYYKIEKNADGI
ncbi:MAG: PIG-L family deacetylase [Paludibacteraceae bacterium]|nr:PIG-L family deacetylase [Paludibacteraceae bacterium]